MLSGFIGKDCNDTCMRYSQDTVCVLPGLTFKANPTSLTNNLMT